MEEGLNCKRMCMHNPCTPVSWQTKAGEVVDGGKIPQAHGSSPSIPRSRILSWLGTHSNDRTIRVAIAGVTLLACCRGLECTGTLIGNSHVLTAAHCVFDINASRKMVANLNFAPALSGSRAPYGTLQWTQARILSQFSSQVSQLAAHQTILQNNLWGNDVMGEATQGSSASARNFVLLHPCKNLELNSFVRTMPTTMSLDLEARKSRELRRLIQKDPRKFAVIVPFEQLSNNEALSQCSSRLTSPLPNEATSLHPSQD